MDPVVNIDKGHLRAECVALVSFRDLNVIVGSPD